MRQRSGFTLMELLLVVMIILMLAGMMMGSLTAARNLAAAQRTRATIEKLNDIIMRKYASYQYRQVDIGDTDNIKPREAAEKRLKALHVLMRHEMPDRESDLTAFNGEELPAVTRYYSGALSRHRTGGTVNAQELLYLIVSTVPEGLGMFSESEIADTDGDGLLEFVDGWGKPIRYLLWPYGFFQDNNADGELQITRTSTSSQFVHDPFDTANLYPSNPALYPLIYSAGPDGNYDINIGKGSSDNDVTAYSDDPTKQDGRGYYVGQPMNDDGSSPTTSVSSLRHFDNIHNHSINNN